MRFFLAGLFAMTFASGLPGQEKDYRFAVDVDRVLLDVYVGRGGQPVEGFGS